MTRTRNTCSICLLLAPLLAFTSTPAFAADCKEDARDFLAHADADSFAAITGREECWEVLYKKEEDSGVLTRLVRQGNMAAARFVAQSMPFTDGPSKQEVQIILSETVDAHPAILLQLLHEKSLKTFSFKSSLTARPERFVDNDAAFHQELTRRKQAVESVKDPALAEEKSLAITYLSFGE